MQKHWFGTALVASALARRLEHVLVTRPGKSHTGAGKDEEGPGEVDWAWEGAESVALSKLPSQAQSTCTSHLGRAAEYITGSSLS